MWDCFMEITIILITKYGHASFTSGALIVATSCVLAGYYDSFLACYMRVGDVFYSLSTPSYWEYDLACIF